MIKTGETDAAREILDLPVLVGRDRPVKLGMVTGTIAGTVLIHQIDVGCRRDLIGDKRKDCFSAGNAIGQDQMAHQKAAPRPDPPH